MSFQVPFHFEMVNFFEWNLHVGTRFYTLNISRTEFTRTLFLPASIFKGNSPLSGRIYVYWNYFSLIRLTYATRGYNRGVHWVSGYNPAMYGTLPRSRPQESVCVSQLNTKPRYY